MSERRKFNKIDSDKIECSLPCPSPELDESSKQVSHVYRIPGSELRAINKSDKKPTTMPVCTAGQQNPLHEKIIRAFSRDPSYRVCTIHCKKEGITLLENDE